MCCQLHILGLVGFIMRQQERFFMWSLLSLSQISLHEKFE